MAELQFESIDKADAEPAFLVDVDGFEGPLDLLLELARRQKVDLAKISVLALAEQYLELVEAARKVFIPIEGDSRVPMREVHQLFAGKGSEAEVLAAAEVGSDDESKRRHRCYAHLYLGLYYEALGDNAKAKDHILKSAIDYAIPEYMGEVARVHMKVRGWLAKEKK